MLQEHLLEGNNLTERKDGGAVRLTCRNSWPLADMAAWRLRNLTNDELQLDWEGISPSESGLLLTASGRG